MASLVRSWRLGLLLWLGLGSLLRAVEAGAPPPDDYPQDSPDSALVKACSDGDLSTVMTLVDQGAPINTAIGKYEVTPLMVAAAKSFDITLYLVGKEATVDAADSQGNTALLRATFAGANDCALELLEAGANPNVANAAGRTPLMNAARNGDDALVKALLDHHAELNAATGDGSAVWWAVARNKVNVLKLLIDAGADLKVKSPPPVDPKVSRLSLLGEAVAVGNQEVIDLLLSQSVDVDAPGSDGTTALMVAAEQSKTTSLEKVLKAGAELDLQNQAGETALMRAAKRDRPLAVEMLCDQRARTETCDQLGRTALIWAGVCRSNRAAASLVDRGANLNALDNLHETALTWAGDSADTELVDMLKQKGALRTDVHVIPKGDPAKPLSPPQAWAMSVGVIYFQRSGLNPKVLGGGGDMANEQSILKRDWNITDKTSLINQLDELRDRGHHAQYQAEGSRLGMMTEEQVNQLMSDNPDSATSIKATRTSYFKWKERSGLAWDLCRSANLVNLGFASGYLDENEAWERLMSIARQTQHSFVSWKEMSENFLDARVIWANKRDPHFDACSQLLLNAQDPNSPWTQNPWKTDLSDATKTN